MTDLGKVFKFEKPADWNQVQEGGRYIFHGPNREELIFSISVIQGTGTKNDLTAVQKVLFQNAEQSMKNAAAHPALMVTQPFNLDACVTNAQCWTLLAQTKEADTLFYQAVFLHTRGILFATFEAPNGAHQIQLFDLIIKSVSVISEGT